MGKLLFKELKNQVQKHNVKNWKDYKKICVNMGWRWNPNRDYKDDWKNADDFFNKETPIFLTYEELKKEINNYNITSEDSYLFFKEKNNKTNWPYHPERMIGWKNWYSFKNIEKPILLTYEELKKEINNYNVTTSTEYFIEAKKHNNWHSSPQTYYTEWCNWFEFLSFEKHTHCIICNIKLKESNQHHHKLCDNDNCHYKHRYIQQKKRMKNDPLYKLKIEMHGFIKNIFYKGGYKKQAKTDEILGCSVDFFKKYIEDQFEDWMNWENRGLLSLNYNETWHLDHFIPLASAKTYDDMVKLNHYTNLRPLCSRKNAEKADKL